MSPTPKQHASSQAAQAEVMVREGEVSASGPAANLAATTEVEDEGGEGDEGGEAADEADEVATPVKRRATGGAASTAKKADKSGGASRPKGGAQPNNVRKLRQAAMMSKAELARRAGVSPLTIDRVESGCPCRMDTKRKILEALGLSPSAREQVFGPDIEQS